MSIEEIQPASKQDAMVYVPYFQGQKRRMLPKAIGIYQNGSLEGERMIEGGESIPFVATWAVSKLPAEPTRCRLQFNNDADLSYEVDMQNSEFVDHLIGLIMNYQRTRHTDFSRAFYRKLLQMDGLS